MERVAIDDVEPSPFRASRRDLSGPLGTTDVAVVSYRLEPGEAFSGALHAHAAQEEVFVVLAGTATFELAEGRLAVGPREAVRFAPGEFQRGYNAGETPVEAVVLGAPRVTFESSPVTSLVECGPCGERTAHDTALGPDGLVRTCRTCGTVNEPGPPADLAA